MATRSSWLPRLVPAALALGLASCLEDRLDVEITTYVHADGSCTRRVEYRLERVDTEKGERRVTIPPGEDLLRRFQRFPAGDAWQVRDETTGELHVVSVQATLPSPNDAEGDFWQQRVVNGRPARNYVSFAMSQEGSLAVWEYHETFHDPASPLAALRVLERQLLKRDDEFADRVSRALGEYGPPRSEVKRLYLETLARPFSRQLQGIAERPVFGPLERRRVEQIGDQFDSLVTQLRGALVQASVAPGQEDVESVLDAVVEDVGAELERDFAAAGVASPWDLGEASRRVRVRATLVMPASIVRANACATGDTVVWEFDQQDLYGRGFEMWARAGPR
jgi:hypothetical protein